ncbi:MAG: hypothetical protein E4H14_17735 [Candidatus Thorarchaeota archaeon]|nr:MAG: hypothetical protein E4H14_17735 [Candidatus Thorarchaeota archaeon]
MAFVCIGFIVGATLSFTVPYQMDQLILVGDNFGILNDLTAPFHTSFPLRSYNQSIDIFLECTNGSLDIVILNSTDWGSWYRGENYTAYFEVRNATSIMTTVEINPPYNRLIDIILQTNYGDARMSVSLSSHCMWYDITTGVNSLLVAIPFALGALHYSTRKTKNEDKSAGTSIS